MIVAIAASIVIFIVTHNYSLEFFVAYLFFLIGGAGAYVATKNWREKHHNSFPIKTPVVVICYLYWAFTFVLAFIIGISFDIPFKLFLLLELLPLAVGILLVVVFQFASGKFEKDDEDMRTRDTEINEINHRITALSERAMELNEKVKPVVCSKIVTLQEAFKYSEIMSQYYTADMMQSIYNGLTTAEIEIDAALDIQPDEATRLENAVTHLITIIKNNDEVCKASKR